MQITGNLIVAISSIIISMACIVIPSSAYGEELMLIYFNGQTGDITKVEHKFDDNKITEKRQATFSALQGLNVLHTFEYSVIEFLDKDGNLRRCCMIGGICRPEYCLTVEPVNVTFRFDRQRVEFTPHSLNAMSQEELKKQQREQFNSALSVMQPRTRIYHLAVVESESGLDVLVIDENRNIFWR